MIDKDAALLHHFLQMAKAQRVGRVPAGAHQLRRISPAAWQHLHFLGHYAFRDKGKPINLEAILAGIDWE
jgi:hypothetical protein